MEKIVNVMKNRKPLSFRTSQMLYGVSILITFVAAGRLGMVA